VLIANGPLTSEQENFARDIDKPPLVLNDSSWRAGFDLVVVSDLSFTILSAVATIATYHAGADIFPYATGICRSGLPQLSFIYIYLCIYFREDEVKVVGSRSTSVYCII